MQKLEVLRADRSENNESEAKDMAGCLVDGERVIAYFPTLSAMRNADLLATAPDMLDALRRLTHPMASDEDLTHALAVIAKAEGRDA